METAEQRAETLLRATCNILKKCEDSFYVLNVLEVTDVWDGTECDGYCLMEDIKIWFDEYRGLDLEKES